MFVCCAGGDTIYLHGKNFGPFVDASIVNDAWYSPLGSTLLFHVQSCRVLQPVLLECVSGPGVGRALAWSVVIAHQESRAAITNYGEPLLTMLTLVSATGNQSGTTLTGLNTRGSDTILIDGVNLGSSTFLGSVVLHTADGDVLARHCEVVIASSSVRCVTPAHAGRAVWTLTVGGQASGGAVLTTVTVAPTVMSFSPSQLSTAGSVLQLFGTSFGPSVAATRVSIAAADASFSRVLTGAVLITSDVLISVTVPAHEGAGLFVTMSVADQNATFISSDGSSTHQLYIPYRAPVVKSLRLLSSPTGVTCADAVGQLSSLALLEFQGSDFGDGLNTTVTVDGQACVVNTTLSTHDKIVCSTDRCAGAVLITVARALYTTTAYDFVLLVSPPVVFYALIPHGPTAGGGVIEVAGVFQRAITVAYFDHAAYGRLNCSVVSSTSSRLFCTSPAGFGVGYSMQVSSGTVYSSVVANVWSFDAPLIDSVEPALVHPSGGDVITVRGVNFGTPPAANSLPSHMFVTLGAFACAPVTFWNDSCVQCVAPAGSGKHVVAVVHVGGLSSAADASSASIGYMPPIVSSVSLLIVNTTGGDVVRVLGEQFATVVPPRVWLTTVSPLTLSGMMYPFSSTAAWVCNVTAYDATWIDCEVPAGGGRMVYVVVGNFDAALSSSSLQTSTNAVNVSYCPPVITSISVAIGSAHAVGGFTLLLTGYCFAQRPAGPSVLVGAGFCMLSTAPELQSNNTHIYCVAPPMSFGVPNAAVVNAMGQLSNAFGVSYERPFVSLVSPNTIDAVGDASSRVFIITGMNFGVVPVGMTQDLAAASHTAFVGGVPCALKWFGDDRMSCALQEPLTVGTYDVTVRVLSMNSTVHVGTQLTALCPAGWYGFLGDACIACPGGGKCPGGLLPPVPLPGFYPLEIGLFAQCIPSAACVGSLQTPCSPAYAGVRCGKCAVQHYRLQGQCAKCPNTAWLLILGAILVVALLFSVSIYLSRKRINLAGLSIGVVRSCLRMAVCVVVIV